MNAETKEMYIYNEKVATYIKLYASCDEFIAAYGKKVTSCGKFIAAYG